MSVMSCSNCCTRVINPTRMLPRHSSSLPSFSLNSRKTMAVRYEPIGMMTQSHSMLFSKVSTFLPALTGIQLLSIMRILETRGCPNWRIVLLHQQQVFMRLMMMMTTTTKMTMQREREALPEKSHLERRRSGGELWKIVIKTNMLFSVKCIFCFNK